MGGDFVGRAMLLHTQLLYTYSDAAHAVSAVTNFGKRQLHP